MILDSGVEKDPARWEMIIGNDTDQKDFNDLLKEMRGGSFGDNIQHSVRHHRGAGFILRRANRPIGYVLFRLEKLDDDDHKHVLMVNDLYISEKERDPLLLASLIQAIRTYAVNNKITHMKWSAVSEEMKGLSKKILSRHTGDRLVPIDKFSIDGFLGRL